MKTARSFVKLEDSDDVRLVQFVDLEKTKLEDFKIKLLKEPSQY